MRNQIPRVRNQIPRDEVSEDIPTRHARAPQGGGVPLEIQQMDVPGDVKQIVLIMQGNNTSD